MSSNRTMIRPLPKLPAWTRIAGVMLGLFAGAVPGLASDYFHVCRTADGAYELNDEALSRSEDAGNGDRQIVYKKLGETLIRRETGYCVVNSQDGARYGYESKAYTVRLSFADRGQAIEVDALCDYAADGLPAAYTCDKQVVVLSEGGAAKPATASSGSKTWMHNGSVMRLDTSGEARKFFYEKPRSGIAKNGASQGTLLFEGTREASRYFGTAYIFKAGCEPAPYEVSGDVASDERSVVMTGDAPRLDAACKVVGTKVDRLIFTYLP